MEEQRIVHMGDRHGCDYQLTSENETGALEGGISHRRHGSEPGVKVRQLNSRHLEVLESDSVQTGRFI